MVPLHQIFSKSIANGPLVTNPSDILSENIFVKKIYILWNKF